MLGEIEIPAVRKAKELSPPPREMIFDIDRTLRVVTEFVFLMFANSQTLFPDTQREKPVPDEILPHFKFFLPIFLVNEVLNFHLLKLACTKGEIPGRNLVPEGLPDLRDTKGKAHAHRINDILKIHEDPLSSFGAKVDKRSFVFNNSLMSLKH